MVQVAWVTFYVAVTFLCILISLNIDDWFCRHESDSTANALKDKFSFNG